jgi:hypothetical protein
VLGTRYLVVLLTAVLCYAALGAVLGIMPEYVHSLGGTVLVGLAVGLAARVADPTGGLLAAAGAVLAGAPVALFRRAEPSAHSRRRLVERDAAT